jgi:hypothetical protein
VTERDRIVDAAHVLGRFTPEQLAAYAGANLNTVRSLIRREPALFSKVGVERSGYRGRPRAVVAYVGARPALLGRPAEYNEPVAAVG